ncbi:hypothetical protein O988_05177 [Pseudogymnoascus sp. VKM F-3808]|nr:hypothetical protein O988_05177 [Pseudogymnoascus sp. VKM F-3808]
MKLPPTIQHVLKFTILASVVSARTIWERQDEKVKFIADLANQLNGNIAQTTHFFETFPTLTGPSLRTQADAAETALQSAIGVVDTIALELSDNEVAQVINSNLLYNDLLLEISLQLQDFAEGFPGNPFSTTLSLYCSRALPQINLLFQIAGRFIETKLSPSLPIALSISFHNFCFLMRLRDLEYESIMLSFGDIRIQRQNLAKATSFFVSQGLAVFKQNIRRFSKDGKFFQEIRFRRSKTLWGEIEFSKNLSAGQINEAG